MNEQDKITIALHEERIKNLSSNVDLIMTNHLPHIQDAVDKLAEKTEEKFSSIEKKLAYWSGGIAVIVVLAQYLLK